MRRRTTWLLALAALAVVSALSAVGAAGAAGTTQVDGVQTVTSIGDPSDPTDDVIWMAGSGNGTPGLIGRWYTRSIVYGVFTPSGVLTATGTEEFDGCLDANGNGACNAGEPSGTLELSFNFSGKFDPATFAQAHGRCHHPITGGTDRVAGQPGFAGATGVLRFKDDPDAGCAYYSGHVTLAG